MTELDTTEPRLRNIKNVYVLQDEQIDHYWPQIVELFNSVPEFWEYFTPEWTYQQVKMGLFQVWALSDGAIRGIVLTKILEYPRCRVFEIMALAGIEMLEFFEEMQDVFTRFAQVNGCTKFSAMVRPGLQRKLRGFGAASVMVILRKDIPFKSSEQ